MAQTGTQTGTQIGQIGEKIGPAFTLIAMLIGAAAGLALYFIGEHWLEPSDDAPAAIAAMVMVSAAASATVLLANIGGYLRAAGFGIVIGAVLAGLTFALASLDSVPEQRDNFPFFFLTAIAFPLVGYILLGFAKAILEEGAPPPYRALFLHGLTLPLIVVGANIIAWLIIALAYLWVALMKAVGVGLFAELLEKMWFFIPFFSAIGAAAIAMMSGQRTVLSALRFLVLLVARIAAPMMAVFLPIFLTAVLVNGAAAIEDGVSPAVLMLSIAFAGMLIFNGVYQNGEGAAPPLWLRLPILVMLVCFPFYAWLGVDAFLVRIDTYGVTPPRLYGMAMAIIAFAYSFVGLAGLISEIKWRSTRWMPVVAPLNWGFAVLWIVALVGLSPPFIDPWAISAKSQENAVLSGKVPVKDFDFGYLRFKLGPEGQAITEALAEIEDHPDADAIRTGAKAALEAEDIWKYRRRNIDPPQKPVETAPAETLEFNPSDNPDKEEEPAPEGGPTDPQTQNQPE